VDEIEQKIKEYIKSNLNITLEETTDYLDTTKTITATLYLGDEIIDSDYLEFPIQ
jgi:hypothetical protein